MFIHDFLKASALAHPDKIAITAASGDYSYRIIDDQSQRLAYALQRQGVKKGDRVATLLENSAEMVIALWAILKIGAICTPINHAVKPQAVADILRDAEVSCLISQLHLRTRVAEIMAGGPSDMQLILAQPTLAGLCYPDIIADVSAGPLDSNLRPEEIAILMYTSGSTGKPKGVMHSHKAFVNRVSTQAGFLGAKSDDVMMCVLPISFCYGLYQILIGALVGARVVVKTSFAFPHDIVKCMVEERVTAFPGVATMFARLIEVLGARPHDLSSMRYMCNGGAVLPLPHIRRLRELLPQAKFFSLYGLTECSPVSYLDASKIDEKPASVGRASPHSEVVVLNAEGQPCAPHEVGELSVSSAYLMSGYWNRPADTAKVLRPAERQGEYIFSTGDLFTLDDDGDLFFVGRIDDVFKCKGEKVSPAEVESILYECDEVAEAAVIGVADPIDGMAVKAFIVLREGRALDEQALRRHCKGRLAPWMNPKFIEFCRELPKTSTGKITRKVLRETHVGAPNNS